MIFIIKAWAWNFEVKTPFRKLVHNTRDVSPKGNVLVPPNFLVDVSAWYYMPLRHIMTVTCMQSLYTGSGPLASR